MKKITKFKRNYSLSKTLRFRLKPVGATEENFNKKLLLQEDEERADSYQKVKELVDEYHKEFIDSVLFNFELEGLEPFAELYYKTGKDSIESKKMEDEEGKLRKQIGKAFTSDKRFNKLFKADMIKKLLPNYFENEEDRSVIAQFDDFTTYFSNFNKNRENLYTVEAKSTGIAHRCINVNLPKFLDNIKSYCKIRSVLTKEMQQVDEDYKDLLSVHIDAMFEVRSYNLVLSQKGINRYNELIGGYTMSDGVMIKGINQYVNLYNQVADKKNRLPYLKPLFKQILSDSESVSFMPEQFTDDKEVLNSIKKFYSGTVEDDRRIESIITDLVKLFDDFKTFDFNGIYVLNGSHVTQLSQALFDDWSVIGFGWEQEYDQNSKVKNKDTEKYREDRKKAFKAVKSFSLTDLCTYGNSTAENSIEAGDYIKSEVIRYCNEINENYAAIEALVSNEYDSDKKLCKDDEAIGGIKKFLDSIKELEHFLKMLLGTGKEEYKDEVFYGQFLPLYHEIVNVDKLYDKVRNYVTKKPYTKDKIKLNFENPQLLGGWDKNKERDYRTVLLRKNDTYYLAIMDKSNNKVFVDYPYEDGEDYYEKIEYKLLPGPNKMLPKVFFANSNIDYFNPSSEILKIRKNETFKKGVNFNIDDCHKMINFYKESIEKHEDWKNFSFTFKPTDEYRDIGEFFKDVKEQGYSISFKNVSKKYIEEMVETGQLYLYEIYNKDFSPYSKGTPNLHTLYFRMLFDERNLSDVVYQLNGKAEMFYRKASLKKERPEHPAGKPISNKNPDNPKKESVFRFDLYKDKRYMENQYYLHLPITLNFKADNVFSINHAVRRVIKDCDFNYIIGIDRGERHLLYISVINENGEIIEQYSMNEIVTQCNDVTHKTNYHKLLEEKENGRKKSKQDWTTIENIKELKEGYLSQVIHKICELVVKYDAVVALEDLNGGFKNSRRKVEKEVYQKFEKMLTEKLAYLVDKKISAEEDGGLLNAYQLTNKPGNLDKPKQDGFIMYVPAWLTSNIDPVTGFVDLLKPKSNMSMSIAKDFFGRFDSIKYNSAEAFFEFTFNYDNFPKGSMCKRKEWTVCTYGDRIVNFRNPEKNNIFDSKKVLLTDEFKNLFADYNIILNEDLKEQILVQNKKEFFAALIKLFALTLQMRNSETRNIEVDYIISPVKDENGEFFDSRKNTENSKLPHNADANGAYNIARKALYAINVIKQTDEEALDKAMIYPKNKEWLEYVQR